VTDAGQHVGGDNLPAESPQHAVVFGVVRLEGQGALGGPDAGLGGALRLAAVAQFQGHLGEVRRSQRRAVVRGRVPGRLFRRGFEFRRHGFQGGPVLAVARRLQFAVRRRERRRHEPDQNRDSHLDHLF
jgi:hypothetical protein